MVISMAQTSVMRPGAELPLAAAGSFINEGGFFRLDPGLLQEEILDVGQRVFP